MSSSNDLSFNPDSLRPKDSFFKDMIFTLVKQPIICSADELAHLFEVFIRVRYNGKLANTEEFFNNLLKYPEASAVLDMWVTQRVSKLPDRQKYAVNLTTHTMQSDYFVDWVMQFENMVFEVAERQSLTNSIINNLEKISQKHQLLLDDFGSGYSNLESLRNLHIFLTAVKIDGKLILGCLDENPSSRAIVGASMRMIEQLDCQAVAECVETTDLLETIKRIRSDFAPELKLWLQGWLFGKPVLIDYQKN